MSRPALADVLHEKLKEALEHCANTIRDALLDGIGDLEDPGPEPDPGRLSPLDLGRFVP